MPLAAIILLPLLGAALPPLAARLGRAAPAWTAALITTTALAIALWLAPQVLSGGEIHTHREWIPLLGLSLSFRLDGLGLLFVLLITGIGLLVFLYAYYYLPRKDGLGRFYALLLLFQGAMLGIVLSDNLILMLIFWELTSLSSFLLIAYNPQTRVARQGARMALAITAGGGLALLAGFLLLGSIVGSFELPVVLGAGEKVRAHPLHLPALLLILIGAFTKSAQFPFHFWLPNAMSAPTPVSAYLHSATMVKAGVFLLARLFPVFSGTETWFYLVGGVGMVTLLFGAYIAIFKHDLKGLLAYSTISHLGLITFLFGLGTPLGAVAGLFHVGNHAVFKASLFMAAGIIDHETGTRDMRQINGLWRFMPYTATLAMVAAAAMAGVPLLNGFLSKEMFFAETVHTDWLGPLNWLIPTVATLAGIFAVAYSMRFIHDVFFNGAPKDLPRTPHEPPFWMKIPVEILVAACILIGIFPVQTVRPILDVGVESLLGFQPDFSLAIWHGLTLPFLMSLVALLGGLTLYSQRQLLFAAHDRYFPRTSGAAAFQYTVLRVRRLANDLIARIDNESLRRYVAWLIGTAIVLGASPLMMDGLQMGDGRALTPLDGIGTTVLLVLAGATLATVAVRHQRLLALIAVSLVGLMVTLTFAHFSAPDLALTQISVELITTVLMLSALFFLPGGPLPSISPWRRRRDMTLATLAGLGAAILAFAVMTRGAPSISDYFLAFAKPFGGGENVVNVILVDFRGLDTLGEITVLAIAATAIVALLWGLRLPLPPGDSTGRPWADNRHPLIMAVLSRPLLPLALTVAVFILLRGHNSPGGGFIAGLVAALGLILQLLASGIAWTEARLRLRWFPLIGVGILLAAGTGLASLLFQRPFLTSATLHPHVPVLGDLELASALVFDIGVFLVVLGTVMLILEGLGRLSHAGKTPTGKDA
ncbi:NADH:ubiquinone oxidoreductase subunit 5 (chain L)/multisubunit Na+/H+ antiporter, MnhA subunit [Thioflavicoccus mobilis 8321]|uniref:NADH:ubiquinone oxidoreductase subunit 5 (Chain L)/multisubunit Na+/H+ antiporter, MnhA subunit n=1 Tax=Thioflavicoccus mobilis 8321 TaxID=765912 RepID=L0GXK4_9GAMM|nr:monovalent cation/H+ antiporter subunit A [Thioflavicoccus mobilis]AGA90562.1 NADH:ubiquinone oxidoreductase subunit 5 (chain L)/multisubunit Na+/H+ antiporter, MnhA subunit [Thioflavicoccus mobilis 8321]